MNYTLKEQTEKRYTISEAIVQARRALRANDVLHSRQTGLTKTKDTPLCVDAIIGRENDEAITLPELNELADKMCRDSINHR